MDAKIERGLEYIAENEQDTIKLARMVAANIKPGDVIVFEGDLGSGKSFFCRNIIKYFCGNDIKVISPTFNLLQTYEHSDFTIYHYDLYRIEDISEIYELGIEEAFSSNIALIEWPNIISNILPNNFLKIKIDILGQNKRRIFLK